MTAELFVLRLVHVLAATFWVGAGLFNTFFLIPALGTLGPGAGPVFGALQQRKVFAILPITALLTILSGARLLMLASNGFAGAYLATGPGRTFAWSGGLAIIAFVFGLAVARPAGARAGQFGAAVAQEPDGARRAAMAAELESLRRRAAVSSGLATLLITLAAAGMAVARYVR